MLRIFLILSLAVSLAGLGLSFVLRGKVQGLTIERDTFRTEKETAQANEAQAKTAERKAKDAEKAAKDELDSTKQELATTTTQLGESNAKLTRTATELEETKVARDTAQRSLARWLALGIDVDSIANLKTEAARLKTERDGFAEEKKVMTREINRLTDELAVYRGDLTEVQMADIRARVTAVDGNYQFVMLDVGSEAGLKQNGKMIITRGDSLVAKVQLVRVEARSAVANLLPDWSAAGVQTGDVAMTSYEALAK